MNSIVPPLSLREAYRSKSSTRTNRLNLFKLPTPDTDPVREKNCSSHINMKAFLNKQAEYNQITHEVLGRDLTFYQTRSSRFNNNAKAEQPSLRSNISTLQDIRSKSKRTMKFRPSEIDESLFGSKVPIKINKSMEISEQIADVSQGEIVLPNTRRLANILKNAAMSYGHAEGDIKRQTLVVNRKADRKKISKTINEGYSYGNQDADVSMERKGYLYNFSQADPLRNKLVNESEKLEEIYYLPTNAELYQNNSIERPENRAWQYKRPSTNRLLDLIMIRDPSRFRDRSQEDNEVQDIIRALKTPLRRNQMWRDTLRGDMRENSFTLPKNVSTRVDKSRQVEMGISPERKDEEPLEDSLVLQSNFKRGKGIKSLKAEFSEERKKSDAIKQKLKQFPQIKNSYKLETEGEREKKKLAVDEYNVWRKKYMASSKLKGGNFIQSFLV